MSLSMSMSDGTPGMDFDIELSTNQCHGLPSFDVDITVLLNRYARVTSSRQRWDCEPQPICPARAEVHSAMLASEPTSSSRRYSTASRCTKRCGECLAKIWLGADCCLRRPKYNGLLLGRHGRKWQGEDARHNPGR